MAGHLLPEGKRITGSGSKQGTALRALYLGPYGSLKRSSMPLEQRLCVSSCEMRGGNKILTGVQIPTDTHKVSSAVHSTSHERQRSHLPAAWGVSHSCSALNPNHLPIESACSHHLRWVRAERSATRGTVGGQMSLVFTKAAENRQGNGDPGASVDCSDFLAGHIRSNVQYQNAGKNVTSGHIRICQDTFPQLDRMRLS